ncbi:MAG: GNAT family N-acetyltransferase [Verrucomicrobiota bacterium]|nr:GNAT family N-acetyltransferase [Verrucomicrobiota bacterium]
MLLHKRSRFGPVGFVNKGPVLAEETPEAVAGAIDAVCRTAKELRLRALVVHPPDESVIRTEDMVRHGFLGSPVPGIADAMAIATVKGGRPTIESHMSRSAKQNYRQALRRGVDVVEGGREDIRLFFELMLGSCRRQGAKPNPGRVESLERLWDEFFPEVRLFLARCCGQPVAGLLFIRFGRRCWFWKKGWNEAAPEMHANVLLNVQAMTKAAEWGCDSVDFAAMDRPMAERWRPGQPMDVALAQSRHAFNLRLGARPVLLPRAGAYSPMAAFRAVAEWVLRWRGLSRFLGRVLVS